MDFTSGSESDSSSSDDDQVIQFIENLDRNRKIPRLQIRTNHMDYWDNDEFYRRYRLSKQSTMIILNQIEDDIRHPTNRNNALSPQEMLLITLRFFASGCFLIAIGDFTGIHKSTVGRIIMRVTRAIANLRLQYISFPQTPEQRRTTQKGFYSIARFPRVVGALDCTHIKIKSPGGPNAEIYRNRKGFFSLNVQTIVNSDRKILDIVARWPGSSHDSTIFNNSLICRKFENGDLGNGVLVGDSGYAVRNYLLTPLATPQTRGEMRYNEAQIRTRNSVECAYGIWKRRWPILSNGINVELDKVQWIIVATAVLHNLAVDNNEIDPPTLTAEEEIAFNNVNNVPRKNYANNNFNRVRNQIINYFENL